MTTRHAGRTGLVPLVVLAALGVVLAGCGASTTKAAPGTTVVQVTLTDQGCTLDRSTVPAGPVSFQITNKGSAAVTEAELISNGTVLAERENVAAGFRVGFAYSVKAGSYEVNCPGGSGAQSAPLTVTPVAADAGAVSSPGAVSGLLAAADAGYVAYVQEQVALLKTNTTTFTDAVRAGDLPAAEQAYPAARVYYERIEPVAESFGNLDPEIDNRIDDAGSLAKLTGFHRLEYAMYVSRSLVGMTPIADGLDADITQLKSLAATVTFQPAQLANGATALLDEVGKTKITGEEERYSHIDFVDLAANVAGSRQAYELLKPAVVVLDPALAGQVDRQFAAVSRQISKYATGEGPTDYASYATVVQADRRALAQAVDALAAPLSQVAGVVVRA